ncbi:Uncharacterised protein g4637 [Pycnogonum litorale]
MQQVESSTVLPPLPPVHNGNYPSSGIMTTTAAEDPIKLWLKIGAIDKLEQAVLDGYGNKLIGKTSRIPKINKFLQSVPIYQEKIDQIHDAVTKGELDNLSNLIERGKLAMCRDHNGASPLHKAIIHGHNDLVRYLLKNYSGMLHTRDHEGRSPLHYAALLKDDGQMYQMLLDAGADTLAVDNLGRRPSTYARQKTEVSIDELVDQGEQTKHRRNHLVNNHFHASRRLMMRAQMKQDNKPRQRSARPIVTKAGLRQLIRAGDKDKLEQIVLYGYGNKLLGEGANDTNMVDFLENVPSLLEKINALHRAVVRGKLEDVMEIMETTENSEKLAIARDQLGATPLHKSVMYGNKNISKYLVSKYPESLTVRDKEGRTALHYAAAVNRSLYRLLLSSGADHTVLDRRGKQADYYLQRPDELDLRLLLQTSNRLNAMYNATTTTRIRQWSPVRKVNGLITRSHTEGFNRSNLENNLKAIKRRSKSQEVMSRNKEVQSKMKRQALMQISTGQATAKRQPFKRISKSQDRLERITSQPAQESGDGRGRERFKKIPKVKDISWGNKVYRNNDAVEITKANIRKWIHDENLESLENVVLEGQGERLTAEQTKNKKVREFLETNVPRIMEKMKKIDLAVYDGDVEEVKVNLDRKPFAFAKNYLGVTPLQRAIIHQHHDVLDYILQTFPESIEATDKEGRTALHYAAMLKDGGVVFAKLQESGADIDARDWRGKSVDYYKGHKDAIDWSEFQKRPPKVATPAPSDTSRRKEHPARRLSTTSRKASLTLSRPGGNLEYINNVVKDGDLDKLEELLLDGHGKHLVGRTSWSEQARNFLKNVPKYLEEIEDFKNSVVNGNEEEMQRLLADNKKLGHARFEHGATAIHLAATNRHPHILSQLLENFSDSIHYKDINGCTPLHCAGKVRDEEVYAMLIDAGSDPKVQDLRGRTAEYYMRSKSRDSNKRTSSTNKSTGSEEQHLEEDEEDDKEKTPDVVDDEKNERRTSTNVSISDTEEDHLDEMVRQWIKCGDLQRLEHVVIAGQGDRLIGKTSSDQQVQEFLDLVPAYMGKIQEVHSAVIRGDVDEVQDKLNRKRFALSRDYLGASPLHLAILHGHDDIVKYIMTSYPETLDGPDNMGRTSLHYAAAVQDGGSLYRMILSGGADPMKKDKFGNTAEDYLNNPGKLKVEELFEAYKHGPTENRELSVQMWERPPTDDIEKALTPVSGEEEELPPENGGEMITELSTDDYPILGTEEGRYLASVMGDVLIKGLTDVSTHRPSDPIGHLAHWLYQYASGSTSRSSRRSLIDEKMMDDRRLVSTRGSSKELIDMPRGTLSTVEGNGSHSFHEHYPKTKDESGQTVIHFAASRSHPQNSFYELIAQADYLLPERDTEHRTARDVAVESSQDDNVATIDKYIVGAILENKLDFLQDLMVEGYDHIFDITNNAGTTIDNVLEKAGRQEMVAVLDEMKEFEKQKDRLHQLVRLGQHQMVKGQILKSDIGPKMITAKDRFGRCSVHISVLRDDVEMVRILLEVAPEACTVTDNMGRTPLHYAMASKSLEDIGKLLVNAGAHREVKDVKLRTPSYNFIYPEEIQQLREQEASMTS